MCIRDRPNSFYELMLNNETIPSAAVRRAIDLALDKEALCLHTCLLYTSRCV